MYARLRRLREDLEGREAELAQTPTPSQRKVKYGINVETYEGTTSDGKPAFIKQVTIPRHIPADASLKEHQRLLDQLTIGKDLDHPNHTRLIDYEESGGVHTLYYEVAPGNDLETLLEERNLRTEEVLDIAEDVARALQHWHDDYSPPYKHNDVTPGNIVSCEEGSKLVDHDSATINVSLANDTSYTTRVLTPGFAAPEVAEGKVSPASDMFGLGMTIAYMITKHRPGSFFDYSNILKRD